MQEIEFCRLHEVFKSSSGTTNSSIVWKFGMPALIDFQFHMNARIDDTTQVIMEHVRVHDNFEKNALKTRLNWSKNVQDKRHAPWQIVMGSMNPVFGLLISLGLWLELNLHLNPTAIASPFAVFAFSDNDVTVSLGGQKAKEMAQNMFGQKVFKH